MAAADVFVLSANHEAQPIALLEAMRELPASQQALGREGAHAVTSRYNRKSYQESFCRLIEEIAH